MLNMILPGVMILRDAGRTTRNPKINARRNIFLYTSKSFNLEKTYNKKIKAEITNCELR